MSEATNAESQVPPAKVLVPKEPPKRNWQEVDDTLRGKKVYTVRGVGFIQKIDHDAGRYLTVDENNVEHDVSIESSRFTALDPKYAKNRIRDKSHRTASGAQVIHNGSPMSLALRGLSVEQLRDVAQENDVDFNRWNNVNAGMKRMNLGNVLAGKEKKNPGTVKILGLSVEDAGVAREADARVADAEREQAKAEKAAALKAKKEEAELKKLAGTPGVAPVLDEAPAESVNPVETKKNRKKK